MQGKRVRQCVMLVWVFVAGLAVAPRALADDHVKGVITGRGNDGTVAVRADNSAMVTVVLTETTKIRRTDGARSEKADAATLIPGLRVKIDGAFEGAARFIAERVEFTRHDLKAALEIYSGVETTDKRSIENQRRIEQSARSIDQHGQTLAQQGQQIATGADRLRATDERVRANEEKLVATTGTIEATNARIANLDNYNVLSTTTVYFKNGQASIDPKSRAQLQQFAIQARSNTGYVIQVEGHASAVGAYSLNQRLSAQRAEAVASVLQQSGIAPTNMLTPAAMGVSAQVAPNKTAKGQAENRRVVVTVLQNKGITGN